MSDSRNNKSQKPARACGASGITGSDSAATEGNLLFPANDKAPHLALDLMERICNPSNLNKALKKVGGK